MTLIGQEPIEGAHPQPLTEHQRSIFKVALLHRSPDRHGEFSCQIVARWWIPPAIRSAVS